MLRDHVAPAPLWFLLSLPAVLAPAGSPAARAQAPDTGVAVASSAALTSRVQEVLDLPEYRTAHWGLLVVDRETGETVYEHNADRLFAPASVTKLFSCAAALDELGADFRFETPVYYRGDIDDEGTLAGDLILVASGDPNLGGRTRPDGTLAFTNSDHIYANGNSSGTLTDTNPLAGLEDLARQIADAGIRRVQGEVLIDDRLFDPAAGTGSGPSRLTPIVVNDNLVDILIHPGSEPGQPARIELRPQTAFIQMETQVTTALKGTEITVADLGNRRFVVRGRIEVGRAPLLRTYEVAEPAAFARALFIEVLRRQGVEVTASPLASPGPELPPRGSYDDERRVALHTSAPFSEAMRVILKVSHNLHASMLPLLLAARHEQRSLGEGLRLQGAFLERAGVDVETISFGGGAGGDRADYVTPRATVQLLCYMATRDDFDVYREALPVLGNDGTLADVVSPESPACGRVQAKTGTLLWYNALNDTFLLTSKALAGYMTTAGGRELAFAFFLNNAPLSPNGDTAGAGRTLGRLCEIFCEEL